MTRKNDQKLERKLMVSQMNSILQAITVLQEEIDAANPERKKEREAARKGSFFSTISKKLRGGSKESSSKEKKKKARLASSKSLSDSTFPAAAPAISKQQTFRRSKTESGSTAFSSSIYRNLESAPSTPISLKINTTTPPPIPPRPSPRVSSPGSKYGGIPSPIYISPFDIARLQSKRSQSLSYGEPTALLNRMNIKSEQNYTRRQASKSTSDASCSTIGQYVTVQQSRRTFKNDVAAKDKEAQMSNYVAVDAMRSAKLNQLRQIPRNPRSKPTNYFFT